MAFFKKLKDRLFKSSSKLDAGLEAIVDEAPVPVAGAQADLSGNDLPEDDHPQWVACDTWLLALVRDSLIILQVSQIPC